MAPIAMGLQVGGQISQGISTRASANANAALADSEATAVRRDGVANISAARDEQRRLAGEAVAAMGGTGLAMGTGSLLDVLRDSAMEAELDLLQLRTNSEARARARELEAENYRQSGRMAMTQAMLGAASSVVSGVQSGGFGATARPTTRATGSWVGPR